MGFIKEFREFVSRGKVIDIGIGVVIGSAFHKIISSLVSDVIMPPLGLIGGINFTAYKFVLRHPITDTSGKIISEAITLNAGRFIQTFFDFLIIAFTVFIFIKAVNRLNKRAEEETPTKEEKLLTEIRDLLKQK